MVAQNNEVLVFIAGDARVGKTAIVQRLVSNIFLTCTYGGTNEETYRFPKTIDNVQTLVELVDIPVTQEYQETRDEFYRTSDGYLLTFDLTNRRSFESLQSIREDIMRMRQDVDHIPFVVVATKCDVKDDRQVGTSEGQNYAKDIDATYFETSAKLGINLEESLLELVRKIRAVKGFVQPQTKKCTLM